jgi:putative ubiquitin-RnfH superfamily antitoxin RatB of RatAB toxin-antitoxin module
MTEQLPVNENTDDQIVEKESQQTISIEVAYALPKTQVVIPLQVEEGTTIEQAIKLSGILETFPDIDLSVNKVGVFSKLGKLDQVLREKDRVEIYRKLIADPKQIRKQRAAEGKKMKKGGG